MILLLVYLFTALFVSFICSLAEAGLLSVSVAFLKGKAQNGDKKAQELLDMKSNIDKPLSAILSLNTVAHTVGAAGVGAQATYVFGQAYFGIVSAVLTLLILVLTEIIPKTLGANYAKSLYKLSANSIKVMLWICYPLVILSSFVTKRLTKKENHSTISREEIAILASIGEQEGVLEGKENKIIQNIIRLKTVSVEQIITPRIMMKSADSQMDLRGFLQNKELLHFSRIPIYATQNDNIIGYVLREVVFENLAEDKFDLKLVDIKRDILIFSERISVVTAWNKFIEHQEHIAVITNEYGEISGLLTLEDILETLLGFEIVDEKDRIVDLRDFALKRWQSKQKKYQYLDQ
ncbi:CNNM domain-containing protein [Myroides sp. LJL119]